MQENLTIARPYAQAVFETAQAESDFASWSSMLEILKLIVENEQMQSVIGNPRVENSTLLDIVNSVCGDKVSASRKNFVQVLVEAGRLSLAPHISELFEEKRAEAEGVANVDVVSAFPLEEAQQNQISSVMEKRLGRKVVINTSVDESLIGGAVIRSGDSVIDASVAGRLEALGNEFAE